MRTVTSSHCRPFAILVATVQLWPVKNREGVAPSATTSHSSTVTAPAGSGTLGVIMSTPVVAQCDCNVVADVGCSLTLPRADRAGDFAVGAADGIAEGCGEVVTQADTVKGYDHDGETVIMTDSDLATIESNSGKEFEILRFIRAKQINPMLFSGEKAYYLVPDVD